MSPKDEIADLVHRINGAWTEGRFDELNEYFSPDMVLAMPGGMKRIIGREEIIASYREFSENATIHDFEAEAPVVDVFDGTAIATTGFRIGYEYEGKASTEGGTDLLVFEKGADGWRVVWRTVILAG